MLLRLTSTKSNRRWQNSTNPVPDHVYTFSWGRSEPTDRNVELYPQFFLQLITTQLRFHMVSPQLVLLMYIYWWIISDKIGRYTFFPSMLYRQHLAERNMQSRHSRVHHGHWQIRGAALLCDSTSHWSSSLLFLTSESWKDWPNLVPMEFLTWQSQYLFNSDIYFLSSQFADIWITWYSS